MHSAAFDALTADEIRRASSIIRTAGIGGSRPGFGAVFTQEPDKAAVREGSAVSRQARALVLDRDDATTYDVLVDLDAGTVLRAVALEHGSAPMLAEEATRLAELIKADPRYVAALAKRGITDLSLVQLDPWGMANRTEFDLTGRRLFGTVSYLRHFPDDNAYAHPIEGVLAVADMVTGEVVDVRDLGVRPMNPETANYAPEHNQPMRGDVKPLHITQPEGVGFQIDGTVLTWQKWRMRIAMHPLEGLVLHGVEYRDGDDYRSVMHRGSLSEMVVPYGEPSPAHNWRSAFDAGEYGLGRMANSLTLGCDCLGEIVYLDAVFAGDDGEPEWIENAVCIHEEDHGILWKHTDWVTGKVDVRRSRRLVVSSIATVGNYHYGFYWNFGQDGSIEVEVKLLGIVQTRAVADGEPTPHGTPVAQNLIATYHQHVFSFRLDMEVDGWRNTVVQNDAHGLPTGPDNPQGNAIAVTKTVIAHENDGDPVTNTQTARSWTVINPGKTNRWGMPVGYKFLPGWASATLLAHEPSMIARRAGFAARNVWVTPYHPEEIRASGDHPNQDRSGVGLPQWTQGNRPVADTDVVLWHTLGVTHIPRAEDWPVMPTEVAGFWLLPNNFFDENPALDVPPAQAADGACHVPSAGDHCHH